MASVDAEYQRINSTINNLNNMKSLFFIVLLFGACVPKQESLSVQFAGESFQKNWAIAELNPELPSDWASYEYLTFDINVSSTQRFYMNLYNAGELRRLTIHPFENAWVRASIPLIHFQKRNTNKSIPEAPSMTISLIIKSKL